jgi:hypothetical protein
MFDKEKKKWLFTLDNDLKDYVDEQAVINGGKSKAISIIIRNAMRNNNKVEVMPGEAKTIRSFITDDIWKYLQKAVDRSTTKDNEI